MDILAELLASSAVYILGGFALTLIILGAIGFGPAGVIAGSLAAGIQSIFYGAFTGGIFAVVQSFAAIMYNIGKFLLIVLLALLVLWLKPS